MSMPTSQDNRDLPNLIETADDVLVVLDTRETFVKAELEKLQKAGKFPQDALRVEQLLVGDIEFRKGSSTLLIMERKTTPDFYSSIISKRYAEQRERLKQSNCMVAYLLESYGTGFTSFAPQNAMKIVSGAVENLVLYDNIKVIPTLNTAHTATTVVNIWKKLSKNPDISFREKSNSVQQVIAKRKSKIMDNMFRHQLLLIPGVSDNVAQVIVSSYPSITSLTAAYDKHVKDNDEKGAKLLLADLKIGKKKLGPRLSERIYNIYTKKELLGEQPQAIEKE